MGKRAAQEQEVQRIRALYLEPQNPQERAEPSSERPAWKSETPAAPETVPTLEFVTEFSGFSLFPQRRIWSLGPLCCAQRPCWGVLGGPGIMVNGPTGLGWGGTSRKLRDRDVIPAARL
uniref:Uncharacterized protein n=1 Tax=Xenopus tropicalis TaxID=8364 RepID=A0A1B8XYH7_XENTR